MIPVAPHPCCAILVAVVCLSADIKGWWTISKEPSVYMVTLSGQSAASINSLASLGNGVDSVCDKVRPKFAPHISKLEQYLDGLNIVPR